MRDFAMNENVKNLLMNPMLLDLVFGSSFGEPDTSSDVSFVAQKLLRCYTNDEISEAKYILCHLDDDLGLISKKDVEELRKRIKSYLKTQK